MGAGPAHQRPRRRRRSGSGARRPARRGKGRRRSVRARQDRHGRRRGIPDAARQADGVSGRGARLRPRGHDQGHRDGRPEGQSGPGRARAAGDPPAGQRHVAGQVQGAGQCHVARRTPARHAAVLRRRPHGALGRPPVPAPKPAAPDAEAGGDRDGHRRHEGRRRGSGRRQRHGAVRLRRARLPDRAGWAQAGRGRSQQHRGARAGVAGGRGLEDEGLHGLRSRRGPRPVCAGLQPLVQRHAGAGDRQQEDGRRHDAPARQDHGTGAGLSGQRRRLPVYGAPVRHREGRGGGAVDRQGVAQGAPARCVALVRRRVRRAPSAARARREAQGARPDARRGGRLAAHPPAVRALPVLPRRARERRGQDHLLRREPVHAQVGDARDLRRQAGGEYRAGHGARRAGARHGAGREGWLRDLPARPRRADH